MAILRICRNFVLVGKNKIVQGVFIKNNTYTPTPTISQTHTPTFASFLSLAVLYTNINLQKTTTLALKLFIKNQKHRQF